MYLVRINDEIEVIIPSHIYDKLESLQLYYGSFSLQLIDALADGGADRISKKKLISYLQELPLCSSEMKVVNSLFDKYIKK